MVFPFMFQDVAALRPLRETAELLASRDTWPTLYDTAALAKTSIPVVAASYVEDMYVDWHLAQETVQHVKGIRQWSTSEYMHRCVVVAVCGAPVKDPHGAGHAYGHCSHPPPTPDSGVRDDGATLFDRLLGMARGSIPLY